VGAGRRAAVLAGVTVVAAVLVAGALWPLLRPLAQRTALPPAARATDAGVPVPAAAQPCTEPPAASPGSASWCLPAGVNAATVSRWYDSAMPAGHDAGPLRWCVEQRLADGGRRALWSTGTGLVGYELPPLPSVQPAVQSPGAPAEPLAVTVVTLAGSTCPAAARTSREGA
jgi:hypothetical protein